MHTLKEVRVDFHERYIRNESLGAELVTRDLDMTTVDLSFRHLDKCRVWGGVLKDQSILKASFKGATLQSIDMSGTTFTDCDLSKVDFRKCNLSGVNFVNCDMRYADLRSTVIDSKTLFKSDIKGALFNKDVDLYPKIWYSHLHDREHLQFMKGSITLLASFGPYVNIHASGVVVYTEEPLGISMNKRSFYAMMEVFASESSKGVYDYLYEKAALTA